MGRIYGSLYNLGRWVAQKSQRYVPCEGDVNFLGSTISADGEVTQRSSSLSLPVTSPPTPASASHPASPMTSAPPSTHNLDTLGVNADLEGVTEPTANEWSRDTEKAVACVVRKLIFASYRVNFPPINPPKGYTSDTGWGCMLRTCQMAYAHSMLSLRSPRSYPFPLVLSEADQEILERTTQGVIQLFADVATAPFSIHAIAKAAEAYGHGVGEWLGPSRVSVALRDCVRDFRVLLHGPEPEGDERRERGSPCGPWDPPAICLAQDGTLYLESVLKSAVCSLTCDEVTEMIRDTARFPSPHSVAVAESPSPQSTPATSEGSSPSTTGDVSESESGGGGESDSLPLPSPTPPSLADIKFSPVVVMASVMLGSGRTINPDYLPMLARILSLPTSGGIIGGKPNKSYYFVAGETRGKFFVYLDPHLAQGFVPLQDLGLHQGGVARPHNWAQSADWALSAFTAPVSSLATAAVDAAGAAYASVAGVAVEKNSTEENNGDSACPSPQMVPTPGPTPTLSTESLARGITPPPEIIGRDGVDGEDVKKGRKWKRKESGEKSEIAPRPRFQRHPSYVPHATRTIPGEEISASCALVFVLRDVSDLLVTWRALSVLPMTPLHLEVSQEPLPADLLQTTFSSDSDSEVELW